MRGASANTLQHYPAERPTNNIIVLAHGAGAGQRHPFMVTMARGLAERGIDVVTFDFPYMREKRKVPDKAPVLEGAFREAVGEALSIVGTGHRLFIGGKSMGGRMATHLAAQGLTPLSGVIVFGYPLHPPGKPEQLRVAHLPAITAPVLVVQGERDTFGTPDELRPHFEAMTAPVTLHAIAGGDHSLTVRSRKKDEIMREVLDTAAAWMRAHVGT